MKRTNTAKWLESQKRWQINVQKDGVRRSFTSSTPGRNGQREANKKADQWLDDNIQNTNARIKELLDDYAAELKIRTSYSNWRMEESRCRCHIEPVIGHLKLASITNQRLQDVINKAYSKGLSKKTLLGIRATLSAFFKYCRKRNLTVFYPDDIIIPQGAKRPSKSILQPEHIVTLFESDKTTMYNRVIRDTFIGAYRLQVLHGLRPGELIGIDIQDIDNDKLSIKRSINNYGEVTDGKNENAVRSFTLCDLAIEIIQEQIGDRTEGRLFDIPTQDAYRKRWKKYCDYNGIPYVTPYEMRHTFVSVIQALPEGYVKSLVGHSRNMDTFGIYGHSVVGQSEDAANRINKLFNTILNP